MTSWVKDNCVSYFQSFCVSIVRVGRIPRHIAFIMDGNRRYAKKVNVKCTAGHGKGFDKLSEMMKWCLTLGIAEVTVYAFSIENFKRSKEEVDALLDLSRDKFNNLLRDIDEFNKKGIRVNAVGRMSLLPEDLRLLTAKVMLATRHNKKLQLNIAMAYTARDEISRAASHIIDGVRSQELPSEDVTEDLVSKTLDLTPPELLVRTSGEVRLSDFMLWQISSTVLYFTDVLWPDISIWNLMCAILHFQRHALPLCKDRVLTPEQDEFVKQLDRKKWDELQKIVGN